MAAGVDRIVMLLRRREENLREISLFPMNQQAEDLLMGAPSRVACLYSRCPIRATRFRV
jgi:aspartyl-tRNA synthetase